MRWTAVVNPTAGRGRTRRLLPRLRQALEELGVEVYVSSDAEDGRRAARAAVDAGHGIAACGGDGTVREIADLLAGTGAPLAVVPTGAGNDFARHLGIDPKRPFDAIRLLEAAHRADVDLGRIRLADDSVTGFTTVANTGFDAEANRWANDVRWATGTPLYVLAVVRTLARYRPQPVCVRIDDHVWEDDAWLVAVGNGRFYAGGMMITPEAVIDDGMLDVFILGPASLPEFLRRFPGVFKGTHVASRDVSTFRGSSVELSSTGGSIPMEVWASGEHVGPLPARLDVRPRALSVVVPELPAPTER